MEDLKKLEQGHYGALELKNRVGPNLLKGLIISLLIHGSVFASPFLVKWLSGDDEIPVPVEQAGDDVIIVLPPPIKPQKPVERFDFMFPKPDVKYKLPEPVDAEPTDTVKSLVPDQRDLLEQIVGRFEPPDSVLGEGTRIVYGDPNAPELTDAIPPPDKYIPFEVKPEPLADLNAQPDYPELAKVAGVSGRVWTKLWIDKSGNVGKAMILKVDPEGVGFDEEVMKVVTQWKFTPAIQSGHPVGVWITMPFKFALKK